MTRFDDFEQQLAARGWTYDVDDGDFRDGTRRLTWKDLVGLVPGFTLDELASYEDQKVDESLAKRRKK
jgi:hypothetical protein